MSLIGRTAPVELPVDLLAGMAVEVIFMGTTGHWCVRITETYQAGDGEYVSRDRLLRNYGLSECGTAYQALMAALSDWHNHG